MKRSKKIPLRMCVACREMKPKEELMRAVCTKEGSLFLDNGNKIGGRGAYICKNAACVEKARKSAALERAFGVKVGDDFYALLSAEAAK